MSKKDFTEYERDTKDFTKKPLSKDFQKLIFPPESDVKKSEDHDPSVLPTSKLSMRKKADVSEEDLVDIINSKFGWAIAEQAQNLFDGYEPGVDADKFNDNALRYILDFVTRRDDEPSIYLREKIGNYFEETRTSTESSIKLNPKTGAWENLPKGWTEKSLKSFWNSLGGKGEHKVTRCIEKMKGDIDNPEAFCASLERRIESSNAVGMRKRAGTWALPFTLEKATELERIVNNLNIKEISVTEAQDNLYDVFGDDLLFDDLDSLQNSDTLQAAKFIKSRVETLLDEYETHTYFKEKLDPTAKEILNRLVGRASDNSKNKKLAVGDKILTSSKKKAKVVKVGTELAFWMSLDGEEFGSDFVQDVELVEPVEGLVKEVPLEEKVDLGEKI